MTFLSSRDIAAPPSTIFAAFSDVARLARWWGPAGFINTFTSHQFAPGGKWSFVMHGPDGRNYSNEIVIEEIDPPTRIVMHHVSPPRYLLTVTLDATDGGGTRVGWRQDFENPAVGRSMERLLVQANRELLDRLSAEVSRVG